MKDIWTPAQEAANLKRRFKEVENKAEFAREHSVPGGPSMQAQHCSGNRPISLEAAIAYAKGFGVPIDEISPRLAAELREATRYLGSLPAQVNSDKTPGWHKAEPANDAAVTADEILELITAYKDVLPGERDALMASAKAAAKRAARQRGGSAASN